MTIAPEAGFGPRNFSVPAYGATGITHTALHAWEDAAFRAALDDELQRMTEFLA